MLPHEIVALTASQLHARFNADELSCTNIVQAFLQRITTYDDRVNAFLTVCADRALRKAALVDEKKRNKQPCGSMAGVPVAMKDNILVKDVKNTCASRMLENFIAPYDATVVERLEAEDAIIIGKTNLDEFAMGSSGENSAFGPSCNPWNFSCTPGGSSAGSAAAVAASMVPMSFGSDTGGSVRLPGSFCGIAAFKPSYGRVSRQGLVAFGSSLDQIGPLAWTVEDIEMAMKVIGTTCEKDSTSLHIPSFTPQHFQTTYPSGFSIGVPYALLKDLDPEPRKVFDESLETLKSLGAKIVDVDLSTLSMVVAVYYIVATAELSTNLARFDGIRYGHRAVSAKTLQEVYTLSREEGFGREVKRRLMLGTFVLSSGYQEAYYKKAQKVRALMLRQFLQAFTCCDLIAMPVSTSCAFEFGSKKDPLSMYLEDIYTIGPNLAGLPALSVPAGFVSGLPYGLQLIGPQTKDAEVLALGRAFQNKVCLYKNRPLMDTSKGICA